MNLGETLKNELSFPKRESAFFRYLKCKETCRGKKVNHFKRTNVDRERRMAGREARRQGQRGDGGSEGKNEYRKDEEDSDA